MRIGKSLILIFHINIELLSSNEIFQMLDNSWGWSAFMNQLLICVIEWKKSDSNQNLGHSGSEFSVVVNNMIQQSTLLDDTVYDNIACICYTCTTVACLRRHAVSHLTWCFSCTVSRPVL